MDGFRKAKACLKYNLERGMNGNEKTFYRYTNNKRKITRF